jgi:Cysteine-rich CPXCG
MELLAEGTVLCPYCGESYTTMVDTSQSNHETIEDCPVCCRPIQLTVDCEPGEVFSIDAVPG